MATSPSTDQIIREMDQLVSSYVECWQSGESRVHIAAGTGINPRGAILINCYGPCEANYSLFTKQAESRALEWRYQITDLPLEVVIQTPIMLIRSLKAQTVNLDHFVLWSWLAEFMAPWNNEAGLGDSMFRDAFLLLVRLNLAGLPSPPWPPPRDREARLRAARQTGTILELIGQHIQEVLRGSNKLTLSLVLSYPVLERLLKVKCHAFVELDGEVTQSFEVLGKPYGVGARVSSLKVLLYLYELHVASSSMRNLLTKFKREVMDIFPTEADCYGFLFKWRNNALHGAFLEPRTHAVVINLICLLLLDSLQSQYEALRTKIMSQVETNRYMRGKSPSWPWTLFPPDQLSHL